MNDQRSSDDKNKQSRTENSGTVRVYGRNDRRPELLSPAGSMEALKAAVRYGADAVYLGGELFGLRAKARNFDQDSMKEAIAYAHRHGVRVYVTVNIIAHNDQIDAMPSYLLDLQNMQADALIVSDAGVIDLSREVVPEMPLHLSTQASAMNYRMMNFWHRQGVSRIVAAREMSLREIAAAYEKTDPDLELEAFVHGAMCVSISGRCLLSLYMAGRDANQGACVHPCRFQYALMEEKRPGEYMPVFEDEQGTYIMNSKDLCMIEYIPDMIEAGIRSFKIEGRMKTAFYVASVTKAYRQAIDDYLEDPNRYIRRIPVYQDLLDQASHRLYSTGFYLGKPESKDQMYEASSYVQTAVYAGMVLEIHEDGMFVVEQRNKFSPGDRLQLVTFRGDNITFEAGELYLTDGSPTPTANHPKEHIVMKLPKEAKPGMILSRLI